MAQAARDARAVLAAANRADEAAFGHIFIISASGKSAMKFSRNWSAASATTARPNCALPPRNNAKSRACAWRNYWPQ